MSGLASNPRFSDEEAGNLVRRGQPTDRFLSMIDNATARYWKFVHAA